jgi:hypothetical protein
VLGDYSDRAPRWLHEGAAKYYSGDWSGRERATLAEAERTGRLHTIEELAEFPTHPQESAVAYAESYVLVDYLLSLDPQAGLADFMVHLKETGDVERAFRRAYGLSEAEIEAGWREAVREHSRHSPRPWAVEAAIFLIMVAIFGVAFIRVRRRSREIRQRMEEAEEEELLERLLGNVRALGRETRSRPPPEDQAHRSDDNASGTS